MLCWTVSKAFCKSRNTPHTILPESRRPISLLSVFDKLFEKVMYNRLYQHLEYNNILYKYQFGFRKNHGTNLA